MATLRLSTAAVGVAYVVFAAIGLWAVESQYNLGASRYISRLDLFSVARGWSPGDTAKDRSGFPTTEAPWPAPVPAVAPAPPPPTPAPEPSLPQPSAPTQPPPPPPPTLAPPTAAPGAISSDSTEAPTPAASAPNTTELLDEVPPPNTTQTFSWPRPRGELSASARKLTIHEQIHLTLDDPAADVKGSLAICIVMPSFDEEANRLLQSIAVFEAKTLVFIKCTQVTAYTLPKLFPELRFVLYHDLTFSADDIQEVEKAKPPLVRSALEAGVKGAWYMDPGMVLLAPLPAMVPDVDVACGKSELVHLHDGYPSMLYVARPSGVDFWNRLLEEPRGKYGQAFSDHAVKAQLGAPDIHWEFFDCQVGAELRTGRGGNIGSEVDWHGDGFKLDGCAVTSLRLQDQGPTTINFLWESLSKGNHLASVLFDQVPGNRPKTLNKGNLRRQLRRLRHHQESPPHSVWKPEQQVPWWYNVEQMPTAERVVVYNHELIPVLDPRANFIGKVVLCAIFDDIGDEVQRYFQQHRRFHADMTVFVATTQENVNRVISLFPDIRFSFVARLDKYRDPSTGAWLGREAMRKHGLWFSFNAERPDMMKSAMEMGAVAAWYMDTDIALVAPLPRFNSSVEVGLAPHNLKEKLEAGVGHFNSGMTYFASISQVQLWLRANHKSMKNNMAQTVMNDFRHKPGVLEFNCSIDQGWYQMDKGHNKEKKDLADQMKCVDGQISFKGCPSQSFHFHLKTRGQGSLMMPYFTRVLEECMSPAMAVWHKESYQMPDFQTPLGYWGHSFDTIEPVSNVLGNIVFCLIADGIGQKLHRILASLHKFQVGSPVFISGTEELDELSDLYPNMRLRIFPRLKQSSHAGFEVFVAEKVFLLRAALSAGARGARFVEADKVEHMESGNFFSHQNLEKLGESYFTEIADVHRWGGETTAHGSEAIQKLSELPTVSHGD